MTPCSWPGGVRCLIVALRSAEPALRRRRLPLFRRIRDTTSMKWFWILCDLFFIICALALVYTFCGISTEEWDRLFPLGSGSPVRVFIAPGKNGREIADVFRSADIVPSAPELARWLHRFALDRSFRPGTYSLMKGTPWEVARQLRSAVPERITLTIFPGSTFFSSAIRYPLLLRYEKSSRRRLGFSRRSSCRCCRLPRATNAFLLPESMMSRTILCRPRENVVGALAKPSVRQASGLTSRASRSG